MDTQQLVRLERTELAYLEYNERACDSCGGRMHLHMWAVLDPHGKVIECNWNPNMGKAEK